MKELVSIIVPIYNVEDYLEECLNSIIGQTYQNLQILLIDDGSTDESLSICEKYSKKDNRIIISHQSNLGAGVARNKGLEASKGTYIYTCDSDDYLSEDAIEKLVDIMQKETADFVFFDAISFHSDGMVGRESAYCRSGNYGIASGPEMAKKLLANGEYKPGSPLAFYRTEFLRKNRIEFYPGIMCEDELFSFYTYLRAEKVVYCPQRFYHRRLRNGSVMMSSDATAKKFVSCLTVFQEMNKERLSLQEVEAAEEFCIRMAKSAMMAYRKLSVEGQKKYAEDNSHLQIAIREARGFGDFSLILRTYCWQIGLLCSGIRKMIRKKKYGR